MKMFGAQRECFLGPRCDSRRACAQIHFKDSSPDLHFITPFKTLQTGVNNLLHLLSIVLDFN